MLRRGHDRRWQCKSRTIGKATVQWLGPGFTWGEAQHDQPPKCHPGESFTPQSCAHHSMEGDTEHPEGEQL